MKIVYFDYWTEGIGNFVPLDLELRKRDHETILLHLGSFYGPSEEESVRDCITCRDISFYKTKLIYKMLEQENPDVLISLNTTKILDRVVAMSCRSLNIKSVYLMHGIRDLGESNDLLVELMEKSYNSFLKKIKKTKKYLTIVIPNYIYATYKYNPQNITNLRFLKVIYSYFKNPGLAFYFPEYRDEILHDICLVYSENECEYYEKFGYSQENIRIVGNPKCDKLCGMIKNNEFTMTMLPESVRDFVQAGGVYALYLEEGFAEQNNMGNFTADVRDRFIVECAERLARKNIKLVVKLHPVTDARNIKAKHGNLLVETDCLDALIYYSEFCICSLSTTINICILMDKQVYMPQWYSSVSLPTFFIDVGISRSWKDKDDELDETIDIDSRQKFIERYITVTTPDAVNNVLRAIGA